MAKRLMFVLFLFAAGASAQLKNVQVLKDVPQEKFDGTMELIAGSLGVRCQYCHAAAFESDEKPAKKVAREMIVMTREINKRLYEGRPEVTCNTCHQGSAHTKPMPAVEKTAAKEESVPPAQTAADITAAFARYAAAAGAGRTVKSVRLTGKFENDQLPAPIAFEVDLIPPDRARFHATTPRGEIVQLLSGARGWVVAGGKATEMQPWQIERTKATFALFAPVKAQLPDVVRAVFDPQSGMLQRMRVETPTPIGKLPYEVSFDDYRDVGGVKVPFAAKGLYTTGRADYKFEKVELDAAIDPKLFDPPTP